MNNATFSPVTCLPGSLGVTMIMAGDPGVVSASPRVTSVCSDHPLQRPALRATVPLATAVSLTALTLTLMGGAPAE